MADDDTRLGDTGMTDDDVDRDLGGDSMQEEDQDVEPLGGKY